MDLSVKEKQMKKALYYIEEMNSCGIAPDAYTYSIILHGLKINH